MTRQRPLELTAMTLHLLAMGIMLCDHMGLTLFPELDWMRCVGRIAFPIFAFMVVEGYFHTRSLKRYALRLGLFALLSEVPFDLMVSGSVYAPWSQNVLWTLLMGVGLIWLNEQARKTGKVWLRLMAAGLSALLALLLGILVQGDYDSAGLFTVLVFYIFRGRSWHNYLGQFFGLYLINTLLLSGGMLHVPFFYLTILIPRQAFALLSLIPIWLYRGKQGHHNKALRWLYYSFYPVHMLILSILS